MPKFLSELSPEVKYELLGIILTTAGIIGLVSLWGFNAGPVGLFIAKLQKYLFGIGAPVVPCIVIAIGLRYIGTRAAIVYSLKFWGIAMLYSLLLAVYHHFTIAQGSEILPGSLTAGGGFTGGFILFALRKLFGMDGSIIILLALSICALIMTTTWSLAVGMLKAKHRAVESLQNARESIAATCESMFEEAEEDEELAVRQQKQRARFYNQESDGEAVLPAVEYGNAGEPPEPPAASPGNDTEVPANHNSTLPQNYRLPSLALLGKAVKIKHAKISKEISENARLLEETLENFHVRAKIINTCNGPSVTRYELEPAPGVKVSKIVNLADDIALKLASTGVRIEAPIPGKAAIGIEVPNKEVSGVQLREVLESEAFQEASSKLTVALGKDIAGKAITADLAKMPHLLVAGATGSGKSVCINTLITSILFKATPEEVKFVLIDPKMVELSNYNGIPHLMAPVVTDAKKAAAALNWAVQEMERRYTVFATAGVRDMARYNQTIEEHKLPAVVVIIDELADLMMVAPVDVEDAICRLAQKARAAGIHLVLATQRPSVDVITGTIKANVPSRISFAVSSQIDSRTILDMAGAEKLLGKGDMLYYPVGAPKPLRVQGAFVSDQEVEQLLEFIKNQAQPEYNEEVTLANPEEDSGNSQDQLKYEDELLETAVNMVLETGQASVSMLQRKFRIGYTRAARLIDTMEEMRIVGPNIGSKAREILMNSEQVNHLYFKK
ncbi:DNA translocase FtsK 4TM domain-containing protein|uniref:DNA translocase FtsK n=1 Tax=Dendrosporobacter quercicolus TaxID=146817 RepID=A0A1G9LNQ4_9FIRM|nr:DNA translocase FtsK [Dendrosporobacter quercicolus]NSL46773.1 DNA translocase FtsK 4TM domain-containing protein [Dendrosporobacter quercicolus DSM 1736]SDL63484.1 DNA translocase FtsK [Dendrosporobacter quercicolus]